MQISSKTELLLRERLKTSTFFLLFICLMSCFKRTNLLVFYCFFELSLIPILLLILGWGYQPERLHAGIRMVFYTLVASLPLLVSLLILNNLFKKIRAQSLNIMLRSVNTIRAGATFTLVAGFLVKLPIYGFHLWLPRAHVEAPVYGSIVLAAVLLKLGVLGVRLLYLLNLNHTILCLLQAFSCTGGAVTALLCLRITDIKTLVAYSSVAHIGLLIRSLIIINKLGVMGAIFIALSHGLVSSAIFWGANVIYSKSFRRSLLLNKRSLNFIPTFSAIWFIFCLGNMGAPPTLNLVSEIYRIIAILKNNLLLSGPVLIIAGLATAFTLNIFISTQHNQVLAINRITFSLTKLETLTGFNHVLIVAFSFLVILIT